ncbi:MAG: MMPL family transporter [Pseudomonadota bacterium]|nr:MMPL family transporter [Pseudomonadota bacterium]
MTWWTDRVARLKWWVVAAVLSLAFASAWYSVRHLSINTDTVNMLSPELPFRITYESYKEAFPQYIDTFILVVDGPTPEAVRGATRRLVRRLKQDEARFFSVFAPGEFPFFERNGLLYRDVGELEAHAATLAQIQPFLGRLVRDQSLSGLSGLLVAALGAEAGTDAIDLGPVLAELNQAIAVSLEDGSYHMSWRDLMQGGTTTGGPNREFIVVKPRLDYSQLLPGAPAVEAVREIARDLGNASAEDVRVRITGKVALEYEELQSVSRGAGLAAISALIMVLIVLVAGLRSVRLVVITLVTLVTGLVLTAGFATVAVGELNTISVAFGVLYIGLGVDFAIHLCLRHQELRDHGEDNVRAIDAAARDVGRSLLLCALSTAVGFYAFIPTAYSGVSELGLISGTGMFISLVTSLTLLPALLCIWSSAPRRGVSGVTKNGPLSGWLAEFPYRHARAVRWGALVLAALGAAALPFAGFDHHPINLRDPGTESVSTFMDLVRTADRPPWNITILAPDAAQAENLADRLRELPVVKDVVTIADLVPDDQDDKLEIIEEMAYLLGPELSVRKREDLPTLADRRQALQTLNAAGIAWLDSGSVQPWGAGLERLRGNLGRLLARLEGEGDTLAGQRLDRLESGLLGYLPENLDRLESSLRAVPVSAGDLPGDISGRWVTSDGVQRIVVYPQEDISDSAALRRFVKGVRAIDPGATDIPVLNLEAGDAVVSAFIQAFAWALVIIVVLLGVFMRNVLDVALVLVPLLLSALLTGASLVLFDIPFNFANIIALPLLLGIGVDNGIHMVHRMRYGVRGEPNILQTATARAVLFSGLTTIVSFGNLAFSSHPGTASMGMTLTLGVAFTLFATLVILPALQPMRPAERSRSGDLPA